MNPKDLEDAELYCENVGVIVNDHEWQLFFDRPVSSRDPRRIDASDDVFSLEGEFSEKISEDRLPLAEEMKDASEEPTIEEKTPATIDQIQQIINQEKLKAYVEARDVLVETFRDDVLKDYIREVFREKFGV